MEATHIVHAIPPTFDERSRVLVLGSIPSPKSRETGFNYGHPRNRFWHVLATLADEPLPTTNDRKRDFCLRHHIALWDVVAECDIAGASDSSIRNARANDLARITAAAPIEAVYCTGSKAYELYRRLGCEQATGLAAVRLPSTSPANAAAKFEQLTSAYAEIFEHTHEFEPPALDVSDVVALEQAIAASGTSLAELMNRAGGAVTYRTLQILAEQNTASPKCVTILCGNGNNGGDGWVAAELLAQVGCHVSVIAAKQPGELSAEPAHTAAVRAALALHSLADKQSGATAPEILIDPTLEALRNSIEQADVLIDAILGTGFHAEHVREPFASWISVANESRNRRTTLAVDVASGVNAQTGSLADPCIIADETLTMMVRKPGLTAQECGLVRVAPLAYIEPLL